MPVQVCLPCPFAHLQCDDLTWPHRWQNPLIGWTSTGDPMEHVAWSALDFHSKEEAVAFAEKQGFTAVVREPNRRRPDRLKRYAGYGDNYRCCASHQGNRPLGLENCMGQGTEE